MHTVFNIPAGEPFLENLLAGLKRYAPDELQSALILLPTRRACTALRDLFLRDGAGGARLLPTIRQLSLVDEDELLLSADADLAEKMLAVPPAISPMRRRLLLTKLILLRKNPELSHAQAFALAADLGRLIDQVLIEDCDFKNLEKLVDGDLAKHWQMILQFLSIITEHWPAILQEQGVIENVDRRKRLLQLQIEHWQKKPPKHLVIAAGSTGSHPSTALLLKTISELPRGAVVLPALDLYVDEPSWDAIGPTHPQYLLKKLLKKLDTERANVLPWHVGAGAVSARTHFLSEVMRPAEHSDDWAQLNVVFSDTAPWRGVQSISAQHEQDEAMCAALILRKAIEDGEESIALITPDRSLAIRTATYLRRWNVMVDDSAGTPLSQTSLAGFFTLLLQLPRVDLKPSDLMAFLKHPKTAIGLSREECLRLARAMEIDFFRTHVYGQGIATWQSLVDDKRDYAAVLNTLADALKNIFASDAENPFVYWLDQHLALAERWSKDNLWQGAEGEVLAEYIDALRAHSADYICSFDDYSGIFTQGLAQESVRTRYGQDPRVHILGLIEARMLSFNTVILAGLNEGTWPEAPVIDPWMSPSMRVAFGLPSPDQHIGQTAHDFVQLAAQKNVLLLRSERKGEAPTNPSRWLLRLNAMLMMLGMADALTPVLPWHDWAKTIDKPNEIAPCSAPAVRVSAQHLPTELSATNVELWMRDPYAFYAKTVLKFRALGDLDAEMSAKDRGNIVHTAFDVLAKIYPHHWPAEAEQRFIELMVDGFTKHGSSSAEIYMMQPRLAMLAREVWEFEHNRRKVITAFYTETCGDMQLHIKNYTPMLHAKADRIDVLPDNTLQISDYKTGEPPSKEKVISALSPQLLVEAIIAENKGFSTVYGKKVSKVGYIHVTESQKLLDEKSPIVFAGDNILSLHQSGLFSFIESFLAEAVLFHSVPRPSVLPPAQDYARLARVAEWSKGEIEQEDS